MSMTKPGQDHVRYEVITQEDPDTGDLIMPIPPQLLEKLGWKEGDQISFDVDQDRLMSTIIDPWTTFTSPNTSSPTYTVTTGANLTSTGNVLSGSSINWSYTNIPVDPNLNGATLKVKGDADIEGDLKVQGKSIKEALDNIEKRLAILHPNQKLEEKWERLKALGDMYRELEAEILEKEEIWSILKK